MHPLYSDARGAVQANWGRNTVGKALGGSIIWRYNMGGTAGTIAVDDTFVYAMRDSGATVTVLHKTNGTLVRSVTLTGSSDRFISIYGIFVVAQGKLFRGGSCVCVCVCVWCLGGVGCIGWCGGDEGWGRGAR